MKANMSKMWKHSKLCQNCLFYMNICQNSCIKNICNIFLNIHHPLQHSQPILTHSSQLPLPPPSPAEFPPILTPIPPPSPTAFPPILTYPSPHTVVVSVSDDSYQSWSKMNCRDPRVHKHEPKPWAQAEKCEYSMDKTNTDI